MGDLEWTWPRAGKIKFSHLQFDTTVYDWRGAQITLICFNELTYITAHQFFYMVSRKRSTCGVRPYIRATCNPDADSWVAEFLARWRERVLQRSISHHQMTVGIRLRGSFLCHLFNGEDRVLMTNPKHIALGREAAVLRRRIFGRDEYERAVSVLLE